MLGSSASLPAFAPTMTRSRASGSTGGPRQSEETQSAPPPTAAVHAGRRAGCDRSAASLTGRAVSPLALRLHAGVRWLVRPSASLSGQVARGVVWLAGGDAVTAALGF